MLRRFRPPTSRLAYARWATVTPIPMPALSPTMTQGTITEWNKQPGDALTSGDKWGSVETDKATAAFNNTTEEGYVAKLLVEAGSVVPIGKIIALIVEEKADIDSADVKNWKDEAEAPEAQNAPAAAPAEKAPQAAPQAVRTPGERAFSSPLAKKLAAEKKIDLSTVVGTGPGGRITKEDILNYKPQAAAPKAATPAPAAPPAASITPATPVAAAPISIPAVPSAPVSAAFTDIPLTGMRRTIASRLTQAKNVDVPHYYETVTCVVDNMADLIKHLNKKGDGKYKITVNDFLIKAMARTNLLVPECNTHWCGDVLRQYHTVDVSVAVATPTGLITPIVKDAHAKGLVAISTEVKALAKKAKAGELQPNEYQGGTVCISNLGGMGINHFTAIVNPPQSMILAVGNIRPQPEILLNEEGEYEATGKIQKVMSFTASFDHRVIDGAKGAEWFKHFQDTIENPLSLLL